MQHKIKLTIIIPHYNSSDLLEKLLSTIPKDKNIEVIVIDDKSEDKHIDYIQNIKKSKKYTKFALFQNETSKKGAGTSRNIGLEKAKGQWILFADADDYFSENFYENVSKYFESENDIVFFKPTSIYIDTGELADRHINIVNILDKHIIDTNKKNELNLRYNLPGPICKLIKKDFLDKNKIKFEEVIASNDVMFSTKVGYLMKRFDISDDIIYIITRNYGSLTANMSEQVFDARFHTIISQYNFLKNKLLKKDFIFLNLERHSRSYIVKSMKYGIIKLFRVLIIIRKNKMKFFHYKLLNPIHLLTGTLRYRKKLKKDEKYAINEKL